MLVWVCLDRLETQLGTYRNNLMDNRNLSSIVLSWLLVGMAMSSRALVECHPPRSTREQEIRHSPWKGIGALETQQTRDVRMWQLPDVVADWLTRNGQSVNPPVNIERVGYGQSNLTTVVTDRAGRQWVMREPPPGRAAATAHDVEREAKILRCLSSTDVPVPTVIGTGVSPSGSPFLVMNRIEGAALEHEADATKLSPEQRRALGASVAHTLGRLHRIDPRTLGLPVSRTPFLERQLRRIGASWELQHGVDGRNDGDWQRVRATLVARLPEPTTPVIVHGDFRLSNVLVHDGVIRAVLDWELCTIGDATADLAWLLDDWRSPEDEQIVMPSPTRAGGFPNRDEMVAIYRDTTGFDVSGLDYHRAFTQWRAASLLQGVLARRRAGAMGSHGAIAPEALEDSIGTLLRTASQHLANVR